MWISNVDGPLVTPVTASAKRWAVTSSSGCVPAVRRGTVGVAGNPHRNESPPGPTSHARVRHIHNGNTCVSHTGLAGKGVEVDYAAPAACGVELLPGCSGTLPLHQWGDRSQSGWRTVRERPKYLLGVPGHTIPLRERGGLGWASDPVSTMAALHTWGPGGSGGRGVHQCVRCLPKWARRAGVRRFRDSARGHGSEQPDRDAMPACRDEPLRDRRLPPARIRGRHVVVVPGGARLVAHYEVFGRKSTMVLYFRQLYGLDANYSDCVNIAEAYGTWENNGLGVGYCLLRSDASHYVGVSVTGLSGASRARFDDQI